MKETIRQQLLEHYARDIEGLNVEGLIAEALASIEAMFSYMNEDDVFKRSRSYAVSYLALCAAQELLFKKPVNGWISVKDRVPENDGKYMVLYKGELDICEFDTDSQTFGYTYDDYDEMYSHLVCWDDCMDKYVTHWMPLPELPKEDKDG